MSLKSLIIFLSLKLIVISSALSAAPENDDIKNAKALSNIPSYCSSNAEYNNLEATTSSIKKGTFWNTEGKDIWFKFTATATDVHITITGKDPDNNNTLLNPLVALYIYENNVLTEQIGSMLSNNNITTSYKGGLAIGQVYHIRISAEDDAIGTFKMCINNYNPPKKPGQDCVTASLLCNKESFTELSISGAGNNNREATGSCLSTESNSAWYTWTAANNGTLTFSIRPITTSDDLDWVLYDLGPNGNCSNLIPENIIRCAAGSGVNCSPKYSITGLNMSSADLTEQKGCVTGQDGWVKYIDLINGHVYALMVDNFSSGNNGFTIAFDGTGEFVGPSAKINVQQNNPCTSDQSFTFTTNANDYNSLKWNFGEGANLASANTTGPHTITYNSEGIKTVVLEATNTKGCSIIKSYSFYVALKPEKPIITSNKPSFCLKDVIELSIPEIENASYLWTGPENFTATTATVSIPITSFNQAGDYAVVVKIGDCLSDAAVVNIRAITKNPVAAFTTDPQLPGKFSVPISIQFVNQSKDADYFEWDFGDGQTSSDPNPFHNYTHAGKYKVSLKAYTNNGCENTVSMNDLVLLNPGTLLVPNSFSPNGDGINDEFNVNITNLKKFNLNIFNRYGEKIFNTNNIFNSWNGYWHNQPVPVGAYFYQITATDLFNKEQKYSGSITLIR